MKDIPYVYEYDYLTRQARKEARRRAWSRHKWFLGFTLLLTCFALFLYWSEVV